MAETRSDDARADDDAPKAAAERGAGDDARPAVDAGKLPPWDVGELPPAPGGGWRRWMALLGPGVVLAGASIGSGEWLLGPAVSAQYGATLLWLASISIIAQVFCNLEVMRYTLYCGEPVVVGFFRTRPGPWFWTGCYAILDLAAIWPYNASNAAVPLAAAILGHLPGDARIDLWGISERQLVQLLGYAIFLAAFVPLIFGGAIYRMLERIMAIKLVIVLGYLTLVAVFMVSAKTAREVAGGFVRFGAVPLRADTVIAGRHFTVSEREGAATYTLRGTFERDHPVVTSFVKREPSGNQRYATDRAMPLSLEAVSSRLISRARSVAERGGFLVEVLPDADDETTMTLEGDIAADGTWQPRRFAGSSAGTARHYDRLEDVPEPLARRFRALVINQGSEPASLVGYVRQHRRLPDLDWAILASFAAIAGAGGLTNTLFSNYARDKGWGMGARVGAIPSAVGGRLITLSHVGQVFRPGEATRTRWRGWMRHIRQDQIAIWMLCSFLGMLLPCMLSLEFIRNAPVSGIRVAAMTADGMAARYPDWGQSLWLLTLLCGFLVLAPGQVMAGDQIARRWTDIIWTTSRRAQRLEGNQVKYLYYGILTLYGVWGLTTLAVGADPLLILQIGTAVQNVALGFSALHTLYVNRTLLPRELRPGWFMQAGLVACGAFFLGISVIVVWTL